MGQYYAITRQPRGWVCLCTGIDPEAVYRQAVAIINRSGMAYDDEVVAVSPVVEQQLRQLRVVPREIAREQYQITFATADAE